MAPEVLRINKQVTLSWATIYRAFELSLLSGLYDSEHISRGAKSLHCFHPRSVTL